MAEDFNNLFDNWPVILNPPTKLLSEELCSDMGVIQESIGRVWQKITEDFDAKGIPMPTVNIITGPNKAEWPTIE